MNNTAENMKRASRKELEPKERRGGGGGKRCRMKKEKNSEREKGHLERDGSGASVEYVLTAIEIGNRFSSENSVKTMIFYVVRREMLAWFRKCVRDIFCAENGKTSM